MEADIKKAEDSNLNEPKSNKEESKQNNESLNLNKEEEQNESQSQKEKESSKDSQADLNNSPTKENINSTSNNGKAKRHRRGKNETTAERTFKCPDCDKCYLSGPALIIHRKTKHSYNSETEKKSRGRPKKDEQQENSYQSAQIKYNNFLNDDNRKKNSEQSEKNEEINLELIKDNLNNIFRQCKNDLFLNIDIVENYPFYQLIINNWEKDNPEFVNECLSDNNKVENGNITNKINSPPLDIIFFMYLKEFASKTNKNYFWFINKFIVLFRECINSIKKEIVKEEYKNGKEKEYSQLFSAEGIPESCNDFFLEFMQPKNYFGLNEGELIELAQHFCFWLYSKKYTHTYLTLL